MKVAVYHSNRDVRIEEREVPSIGPLEALLRVEASGICGSDVLEWYRLPKAPLVLGHEVAGVIEQVGSAVTHIKPGDRVVVSHHVPCLTCHHCVTGHETLCETLRTTTFDPGGFSQYVRIPAINVDRGVYRMPEGMSFETASLAEPVACVIRAQRVASMPPGHSMIVLGSGLAGLLHAAVATTAGVSFVATTDVNEHRLRAALDMGASAAWPADGDLPARLRESSGRLADIVVVCTGAPGVLGQAFDCVERGGTVLLFALPDPGTIHELDVHRLWKDGTRILSSYAGNRADHLAALDLMAAGRISTNVLITHRLPLERTAEGFRLVAEAGEALKVIIEPWARG